MKILFLGDVVGPLGRQGVRKYLALHKKADNIDLVIANGENATHGHGLSYKHYVELINSGVDIVTSGNHFFNNKDSFNSKYDFKQAIRPYNLDKSCPLKGSIKLEVNGRKVRVINLIGRVFLTQAQTNPFYDLDEILKEDDEDTIEFVDFHAEATAEKRCLAEYADGRITALIGTHTHVQTNDAKLLNKGTFFLTDAGMNGAYDSVLGDIKEASIRRTMSAMPAMLDVPRVGKILINGVLLEIAEDAPKVVSFKLINELMEGQSCWFSLHSKEVLDTTSRTPFENMKKVVNISK